jgi:hypothetical protein
MPLRIRVLACVLAAFATLPSQATAQATAKLGLSIGYPTSIALLWHPSARVGIRPEMALDFGHVETTSTSIFGTSRSTSDTRAVGVGISALFVVHQEENLSLYLSPRYIHRRGKTTYTRDDPPGVFGLSPDRREFNGHTAGGSLGARYALGAHFGVFGEVGVDHDRDKSTGLPENDFEGRSMRTSIRSGVGVVLFF